MEAVCRLYNHNRRQGYYPLAGDVANMRGAHPVCPIAVVTDLIRRTTSPGMEPPSA
jgi:hypothetical protein